MSILLTELVSTSRCQIFDMLELQVIQMIYNRVNPTRFEEI